MWIERQIKLKDKFKKKNVLGRKALVSLPYPAKITILISLLSPERDKIIYACKGSAKELSTHNCPGNISFLSD